MRTDTYHIGYLPIDRDPKHSRLPSARREEVASKADQAMALQARGSVCLVQRRLGELKYEYMMVWRRDLPAEVSKIFNAL